MTVVLVDDHPILSMGLVQGLRLRGIEAAAVEPERPAELIARLEKEIGAPTLVVMDLAMPNVPYTPALVQAIADGGIPVIMLSGSEDHDALANCLLAGAMGIMSKDESVETILDTIEEALAGRMIRPTNRAERLQAYDSRSRQAQEQREIFDRLTSSESEVLQLLMEGRSAAEIAADRFVSLPTVRTQIKAVLAKLCVNSQLEAVALAHKRGFSGKAPEHS